MRNTILFFFMMMGVECYKSDKLGDILTLGFDLLEEEKDEIKEEYHTRVDECICPPRDSGDTSDTIE
jgi:hypothetical protein